LEKTTGKNFFPEEEEEEEELSTKVVLPMEQYFYISYKNKLIEGSCGKFDRALFKNDVISMIIYCSNLLAMFIINHFCIKTKVFVVNCK
jgi:hypothetical protein